MGAGPSVDLYSDHEADGFILHVQYLSSYICVHSAYTETFAVSLTLRIFSLRIKSFVLSLTGLGLALNTLMQENKGYGRFRLLVLLLEQIRTGGSGIRRYR